MKTIEQVMEGVTAGGKWEVEKYAQGGASLKTSSGDSIALMAERHSLFKGEKHDAATNAAFAARAARSFELMARALERVVKVLDSGQPFYHGKDCSAPDAGGPCDCWVRDTKAALAEALKDL